MSGWSWVQSPVWPSFLFNRMGIEVDSNETICLEVRTQEEPVRMVLNKTPQLINIFKVEESRTATYASQCHL